MPLGENITNMSINQILNTVIKWVRDIFNAKIEVDDRMDK